MSAVAPAPARPQRRRAPSAPATAPAPARRSAEPRTGFRPRRLSAGGLASLLVLGVLLGGLVALNVAALRASMQASRLSASAQALQQANRGLVAEVTSLTGAYRIDRRAKALGMVQHTPGPGDKLRLSSSGHAHHGTTQGAFAR